MAHLISYDIENDKLRTRLAKMIIGRGAIRIQKSVFFADLSAQKTADLLVMLQDLAEELKTGDNIIVIPMYESVLEKMIIIGENLRFDEAINPPNTYIF